jgi:hypothetical protein
MEEDIIPEAPASEITEKIQKIQDSKEKDSEFPGQEIEHPSIREASKEDLDEIKKVKPVIVEWKKPFFITFALAVAAVVLTYILGL